MSQQLAKARFGKIQDRPGRTKDESAFVLDGPMLDVQLNPMSFHIQRSNGVDRKPERGTTVQGPVLENAALQPATLTFDLEFDTNDEGTTAQPVDVTSRVMVVRKFVLPPPGGKATDSAPKVMFQWGRFIFTGIVTQLGEDFDYFAADGTPLHAKVSVTIQELNLNFVANLAPRGATAAAVSAGFALSAGVAGGLNLSASGSVGSRATLQFGADGQVSVDGAAGIDAGLVVGGSGGFSVARSSVAGALLSSGGSASVGARVTAGGTSNASASWS